MKVEHEQRLEAMKQDGGFFNQSSPRVPNRLHQQRTLRGGGGASKSFYNMDMAVLQGGTPVAKQSSMGARPLPNTPPVTQPIRGGGSQDAFASVNAAPPYASPPPAKGSSVLSRFLGNK